MRASKTKALLSIIAACTSGTLVLIYWLAPVDAVSHRLHVLLIDCIPDSVVVAGIAPERVLQATCRAILRRGRKAVLLETPIAAANDNVERTENAWCQLAAEGLVRIERLSPADETSATP